MLQRGSLDKAFAKHWADDKRCMSPPHLGSLLGVSLKLGMHLSTIFKRRNTQRLQWELAAASQIDSLGWITANEFSVVVEMAELYADAICRYGAHVYEHDRQIICPPPMDQLHPLLVVARRCDDQQSTRRSGFNSGATNEQNEQGSLTGSTRLVPFLPAI